MTGPRDIRIECDSNLLLLGRREELRSAFSNLVFNAARYTHDGGKIVVRWFADREHAYLQVEDDGVLDGGLPRLTFADYSGTHSTNQRGSEGLCSPMAPKRAA